MDIGALRHRLTLRRPSTTSQTGYADAATVWGSLRLASTNEALRFGAPTSTGQQVIEIRVRDDVRANWQITELTTGRTFQIAGYGNPNDDGERLRLFCTEIL